MARGRGSCSRRRVRVSSRRCRSHPGDAALGCASPRRGVAPGRDRSSPPRPTRSGLSSRPTTRRESATVRSSSSCQPKAGRVGSAGDSSSAGVPSLRVTSGSAHGPVGPSSSARAARPWRPVPRVAARWSSTRTTSAYRSSAAPTWEVTAMLRERCRRDGAPLWATSMLPSPSLLDHGEYREGPDLVGGVAPSRGRRSSGERSARRGARRASAAGGARALEGDEAVAVVVILQRLGTGRLFACARCGELARCAQCQQAEEEVGDGLAVR